MTGRSRTTPARARRTDRAPARRGRGKPERWVGLDVARGAAVLLGAALAVAAWIEPTAFTAPSWRGIGALDLVPAAFLVLAGVTAGWRADAGFAWTRRRRWQRGALLVGAGVVVAVAHSGGEVAALGPEELLRLAAATGAAAWLASRHPVVPVLVAPVLLLAPAAALTGDALGRALRRIEPGSVQLADGALGGPSPRVSVLSLLAATGLVLAGIAIGRWMHRRPRGPASGAALLTVAGWTALATVGTAQVVTPVPSLLTLPVATGGLAVACALLGTGHLAVLAQLPVGAAAATGRVALVPTAVGSVLVALLPAGLAPPLPALAALTLGGLAAAVVAVLAQHLLDRWPLRA